MQVGLSDCPACVSHVRFVNGQDGYLFGQQEFATHDGGRSWTQEQAPPVEALEPSHGLVFRLVDDGFGCPGPCDRTLQESVAPAGRWRGIATFRFDQTVVSRQVHADLLAAGGGALFVAIYGDPGAGGGTQEAILYSSVNAGATWHRQADPCQSRLGQPAITVRVAASPGFVAALCVRDRADNSGAAVLTSENAGSTWTGPFSAPGTFWGMFAVADAHRLAIATGPTVGYGPTTYQLLTSADGGRHWSLKESEAGVIDPTAPVTGYLGFEDALVGRWIGDQRYIWTTHDGGSTWVRGGVF